MRVDITIPGVGESISEVEIGEWFKTRGESVNMNEALVLVETD
jgi:2-oxoglutarate dehydrogenase E2 component (dihydrolipoamide succinyltransferase)